MRTLWSVAMLSTVLFALADGVAGDSIELVTGGRARAVIVATTTAEIPARRLSDLMKRETSAAIEIKPPDAKIEKGSPQIVLCTADTRKEVQELISDRALAATLKPEGFLIQADAAGGGRVLVMGADPAGLRYGVGELWNYHVHLDGQTASFEAPIWLEDAPAFSKRILWNWTFMTNWDDDLSRIHQTGQIDPGGKLQPYLEQPDGYEKQFHRVIDFAADHKLNGLIIYGFLNDNHGGVEAGQRLSRYARANSVRILPGVGTVIYGGFVHGSNDPKNPYSLTTWLVNHPEVRRMVGKDGKEIASAPCPSAPELRQFLVYGAKWFFSTFPDIGGVNLEHGDFFECACEHCKAERAKPENDHNFLWDMAYTQVPVMKIGLQINPGLWYTFSPYWGYNKQMMADPPRFLSQYPSEAIVQWTYSGMVGVPLEQGWPADLKPPKGANHSIGLLHQGSYWFGPRQWWGSPGQSYALAADVIQAACARAIDDGSEGLEIVGQIGSASPANELNYLAFEAFTWHPKMTLEEWMTQRLARLCGGAVLARRFYEIAADASQSAEHVNAILMEAQNTAGRLKDARQSHRWTRLARELTRRLALIKAGRSQPFGPGPLKDVADVKIDF